MDLKLKAWRQDNDLKDLYGECMRDLSSRGYVAAPARVNGSERRLLCLRDEELGTKAPPYDGDTRVLHRGEPQGKGRGSHGRPKWPLLPQVTSFGPRYWTWARSGPIPRPQGQIVPANGS